MSEVSTPSIRNAFSDPEAPSTWKPPTPALPFFTSKRTPGAIASKVDEALQVDLPDADVVGDAHEVAELADGLAQAGEP